MTILPLLRALAFAGYIHQCLPLRCTSMYLLQALADPPPVTMITLCLHLLPLAMTIHTRFFAYNQSHASNK